MKTTGLKTWRQHTKPATDRTMPKESCIRKTRNEPYEKSKRRMALAKQQSEPAFKVGDKVRNLASSLARRKNQS